MEAVYEELEVVKAELERVKEENQRKCMLHQDLKRAYDDRMNEFQEFKLRNEKLLEDICVKSAEVCEVQRICEGLKISVAEKDIILRELRSANEKLRVGSEEKVRLLEGCNRELVLALDDAMEKTRVLEDKLYVRNEENECLKVRLLATESKCFEIEKKVRITKELSCKDELIARLEDEFRDVQDRLKWKNEQFDHLEEAHDKLRGEFRLSKLEWEKERLVLIDKISSLQSSLDSQTRISSSLQTKLKICNQALAREEGRRKLIEVQLTESKKLFENANAECQEEQAKIDRLTVQRDEEIANARELLVTKGIMLKEMEIKILELEQQKEDMHGSLRELQEAGIKHASSFTSVTKLQKKLRNLESMHRNCSVNLEIKESEWASERESLKADVKCHLSELTNKETQINELHKELEMCRFSLQIFDENMSVVVMVLKSEYSEAYSKLHSEYENKKLKESSDSVLDSKVTDLVEQNQNHLIEESQRKQKQLEEHVLEVERTKKDEIERCYFSLQILIEEMAIVTMVLKSEYCEAYSKLQRECENMRYKESSIPVLDAEVNDLVEQHKVLTNHLEFHKNMVEESHRMQRQLEQHVMEVERTTKDELEMCHFSLQILNEEMAIFMMVLKSEYCEAYLKLLSQYENMKYKKSSIPVLDEKVTDLVEQHQMLTNRLDFHKNVAEESQRKQRQLEEHVLQVERAKKDEIENCQFSLQILKEEMATIIMLLKSEYCEAYSKLHCETERKKSYVQVLYAKVTDLVEQNQMLTNDLEFYKNMIEESQRNQKQLEEHILEIGQAAEAEMLEKSRKGNLIKAKLLKWKNKAGTLKSSLAEAQKTNQQINFLLDLQLENKQATEEEVLNLKNTVKKHEKNISALQQHVTSLKAAIVEKDDALKLLELKNKNIDGIIKELEFKNMHLNEKISALVTQRDSMLVEMEVASNQLNEICCNDVTLLGSFENTEYALGGQDQRAAAKHQMSANVNLKLR